MVQNITTRHTLAPRRAVLKPGQLHILGGAAQVRARPHKDHYIREAGSPWLIEYVVAGSGYISRGSEQFTVSPGDTYVMGPHAESDYRPDNRDPWEKMFVEIEGAFIDSLATAYGLEEVMYYPQVHVAHQLQQLLTLLSHRGAHFQRDFPIGLHRLISTLSLSRKQAPQSMGDYLELRVKHAFQLEEMASDFKYSKNHLLRLFKSEYGCTPYEYLLQRRVEQAIWSITHTSLSIKAIAREFQFTDGKHLSSTIKKRTGKSPSEWRQN